MLCLDRELGKKPWLVLDMKPHMSLKLPKGVSWDEVHDRLWSDYRNKHGKRIPKRVMAASLALLAGRRRGEIARLRREHVDWRHGIVSWPLLKKRGHAILHLPMGNELRGILRRWRISHGRPSHGYVIPHGKSHEETSKELNRKAESWSQGLHRWAKRHGWDLRFHDLRHLFALRLIGMGVPLNLVRKALGHVSIVTTMLYLETRPEDLAPYMP